MKRSKSDLYQYFEQTASLMYIMKYELGLTYPAIGREIGGRDHTTAMHSVEKIEKELKKSPEMFDEMQQLKERFYAHRGWFSFLIYSFSNSSRERGKVDKVWKEAHGKENSQKKNCVQ